MASDWQNRAIPADEPKATSGSSWMDRAVPAEHVDSAPNLSSGPQDSTPSTMEALARGAGQGVTFGFGDELSGGASALADKLTGNDASLLDLYHKYRDNDRAANEAARKAHPVAYIGGNVAGSIPTAVATGGLGELAGLGNLGTVGRMAGQGAIDAGIMGAGNSDADLTSGKAADALQFAKDVGVNTAVGAGAGALLGSAGNAFKSKANKLAAQSLKGTAGQYAELGKDGIQDTGDWLLKNKAVKAGSNAEGALGRIQALKDTAGANIGKLLDQEGTAFGGKELAEQAQNEVLPQIAENTVRSAPVNAAQSAVTNLGEKEVIPLTQLQQIKSDLGRTAYSPLGTPEKEGLVPVERFLNDHIESAIDSSDLPQLKADKADYGMAKQAEALAEKGANRGLANQGISLGDKVAAVAGEGAFGLKGLALGAVNKFARERGQSAAAVGLDKLSQIIQTNPYAMGKFAPILKNAAARGPAALASTHFILSQTEPEYREQSNQAVGNDQQ